MFWKSTENKIFRGTILKDGISEGGPMEVDSVCLCKQADFTKGA